MSTATAMAMTNAVIRFITSVHSGAHPREPRSCRPRRRRSPQHERRRPRSGGSTPATLFAHAKETPALSTDVIPDLTAGACGPAGEGGRVRPAPDS
jgi:hypothetical protein